LLRGVVKGRGRRVLREVSALGSRIRRLRIGGEALLILPRITHGVASATAAAAPAAIGRLSQRAVGGVGKVLCALLYGRHVHRARERRPGRGLGGGALVGRELGRVLRVGAGRGRHAWQRISRGGRRGVSGGCPGWVVVVLLVLAADDHPLIPRAALEAVNGVRRRAHGGGDGRGGEGLRPGRRRGIGRGPRSTDGVECGGLRRARRRSCGGFWLVLAGGAFTQRGSVRGGQVQGGAKVTVFFLELCDALLEGLFFFFLLFFNKKGLDRTKDVRKR
jgi:hypothetical protein